MTQEEYISSLERANKKIQDQAINIDQLQHELTVAKSAMPHPKATTPDEVLRYFEIAGDSPQNHHGFCHGMFKQGWLHTSNMHGVIGQIPDSSKAPDWMIDRLGYLGWVRYDVFPTKDKAGVHVADKLRQAGWVSTDDLTSCIKAIPGPGIAAPWVMSLMKEQHWVPRHEPMTIDSVVSGLKRLGRELSDEYKEVLEKAMYEEGWMPSVKSDENFYEKLHDINTGELKGTPGFYGKMKNLGWIRHDWRYMVEELTRGDDISLPANMIDRMRGQCWIPAVPGRVTQWLSNRTENELEELYRCGWVRKEHLVVGDVVTWLGSPYRTEAEVKWLRKWGWRHKSSSTPERTLLHHLGLLEQGDILYTPDLLRGMDDLGWVRKNQMCAYAPHAGGATVTQLRDMREKGWVRISDQPKNGNVVRGDVLDWLRRSSDSDSLSSCMHSVGWIRKNDITAAMAAIPSGDSVDRLSTHFINMRARMWIPSTLPSVVEYLNNFARNQPTQGDLEYLKNNGWIQKPDYVDEEVNVIKWLYDLQHGKHNMDSGLVARMGAVGWRHDEIGSGHVFDFLDKASARDVWFINRMKEKGWVHFENLHDFILEQLPSFGPYPNEFLRKMEQQHWRWAGGQGNGSTEEQFTVRWLQGLDHGSPVSESFYRDMMHAGWIQKTPESIHHYIMRLMPPGALKELHKKGVGHRVHMKMVVSSVGSTVEFKAGDG